MVELVLDQQTLNTYKGSGSSVKMIFFPLVNNTPCRGTSSLSWRNLTKLFHSQVQKVDSPNHLQMNV